MIPKGTSIKLYNGNPISDEWRGKILQLAEDGEVGRRCTMILISTDVRGYSAGKTIQHTILPDDEILFMTNRSAISTLNKK
jgi:hypothetical protein